MPNYTVGHIFAALTNPDLDWEDAFGFPKPELDDEVIFYCRVCYNKTYIHNITNTYMC